MTRACPITLLLPLLLTPAAARAAPGSPAAVEGGPRLLTWVGPRLLRGDDPPPLYAVTPVPADVVAAALVCGDERVELGPPVWSHPGRMGHAWVVPSNPCGEAPQCVLEVRTETAVYVSDHRIRVRTDAPVSEVLLPATAMVDGSGGGGLALTVLNLDGDVRVRLVSLTRGRSVDWMVSLPPWQGPRRIQIPLPEEILDPGEYILALESAGGLCAVSDQPVFVAGEAMVDLDEVRLEPLSETHSWLVLVGEGAEDIGALALDTSAGRLPLVLEPLEGVNVPTVRARVRTGLLEQFGTVSLRLEESDGQMLLDVGEAIAAGTRGL